MEVVGMIFRFTRPGDTLFRGTELWESVVRWFPWEEISSADSSYSQFSDHLIRSMSEALSDSEAHEISCAARATTVAKKRELAIKLALMGMLHLDATSNRLDSRLSVWKLLNDMITYVSKTRTRPYSPCLSTTLYAMAGLIKMGLRPPQKRHSKSKEGVLVFGRMLKSPDATGEANLPESTLSDAVGAILEYVQGIRTETDHLAYFGDVTIVIETILSISEPRLMCPQLTTFVANALTSRSALQRLCAVHIISDIDLENPAQVGLG